MVNRHSYSQSRSRVYATVDIREGQRNVTRMICHHGLVVRRGSKYGALVVATRLAIPAPGSTPACAAASDITNSRPPAARSIATRHVTR